MTILARCANGGHFDTRETRNALDNIFSRIILTHINLYMTRIFLLEKNVLNLLILLVVSMIMAMAPRLATDIYLYL